MCRYCANVQIVNFEWIRNQNISGASVKSGRRVNIIVWAKKDQKWENPWIFQGNFSPWKNLTSKCVPYKNLPRNFFSLKKSCKETFLLEKILQGNFSPCKILTRCLAKKCINLQGPCRQCIFFSTRLMKKILWCRNDCVAGCRLWWHQNNYNGEQTICSTWYVAHILEIKTTWTFMLLLYLNIMPL